MMDLRKALADIPFAKRREEDGDENPWIIAASVLAQFDPLTLLSAEGTVSPASPQMTALLEASLASRADHKARRLRSGVRRRTLATLGTAGAMRGVLALNPAPDTPTQTAFGAILQGRAAVDALLASNDPVRLAGLNEALSWVEGILPDLITPAVAADRLASARLLAPLRKLVGGHFAGREDVLVEIGQHMRGTDPAEILMLQGPGGVGKSTVLAKFILDALEDPVDRPTVILLNLDNPELVIDDPFTLLQEAGRQLRVQHPDLGPRLDGIRDHVSSLQRRSRSVAELESVYGGAVDWGAVRRIAAEVMSALPQTVPVLLVIDTFEEAQFTGKSAVSRLMQLVHSLQDGNPRLRVVIAGRVAEPLGSERRLTLDALDPASAASLLQRASGRMDLPADLVARIHDITEGNPLATFLAGKIVAAEGTASFAQTADFAVLLGRIRTEQVQARLYGRVLGHIHDDEVRRMAYPGLAVRRITPEVLSEVLAGPCRVNIETPQDAQRLFDLIEREVALVERDPQDGSLRHRADVRRFMLRDLRADQPDLSSEIDAAAVAFYRAQTGPVARAEELYHMMAQGVAPPELDSRWEPGVEPYLASAIDELPPAAQIYLSTRLRLDLRPELQAEADQDSWETITEQTARVLLRDDLPDAALGVLRERAGRRPGSRLFLTEAETLHRMGRRRQALAVISAGKLSAHQAGERVLLVRLRLLASMIHEGAGALKRAADAAASAYRTAALTRNEMLQLRCISALLRLHRKTSGVPGPAPDALVGQAERLIAEIGEATLFDTPGLLRELASELGKRNPRLLATALSVTGSHIDLPEEARNRVVRVTGKGGITGSNLAPGVVVELDQTLPEQVNAMALITAAEGAEDRYAATSLVTDLLALEIDGARGHLPSKRMQARKMAWRESPHGADDPAWKASQMEAF